jgi:uncharacterized protein YecE (DUF72 family)
VSVAPDIIVATAGWSIPSACAPDFPGEGSHLERYARVLPGVEINSSFYRPHRLATWRRWADAVPPAFRFAVKLPGAITHQRRLVGAEEPLDAFAAETAELGGKLNVVLVQLPPSLAFDAAVADAFFAALRARVSASLACEPRHPSWFTDQAEACLAGRRVARVAAHPLVAPGAERPGGWAGLCYHRLHGAPRVYHSPYDEDALRALAGTLRAEGGRRWCVFDNTASGAATANALGMRGLLGG